MLLLINSKFYDHLRYFKDKNYADKGLVELNGFIYTKRYYTYGYTSHM